MTVIKNPIPGMTDKELKEVYRNRRVNGLEKGRWREFREKYKRKAGIKI